MHIDVDKDIKSQSSEEILDDGFLMWLLVVANRHLIDLLRLYLYLKQNDTLLLCLLII